MSKKKIKEIIAITKDATSPFCAPCLGHQVVDRFNEIAVPVKFFREKPGRAKAFGQGDLLIVRSFVEDGHPMREVFLRKRKLK